MRARFRHSGFGRVQMSLRSIGARVPDTARKQMHRSAARIVERARLYVPEDEGNLRESIRIEKSYGNRGRLQIDVVVGGHTVVKASGREIDLDQYAALVHEAYETSVANVNGPGPNTLAKMMANPGVRIGSFFLTRAAENEQERLARNIIEETTKVIRSEGML